MIADKPLSYSERTLGLPLDTYQLGCKMLSSSKNYRQQLTTLHARWHPDLLEGLRTAAHGYKPLPGIGTEFWKNAKLHIQIAYPPPFVPKTIYAAEDVRDTNLKWLLETVKREWNTQGLPAYYQILWQHLQVTKLRAPGQTADQVVLKIPVEFIKQGYYQNGDPITDSSLQCFHGTRGANIRSILENGLHSSEKAHKAIGLWLNDQVTSALDWNTSLMDVTSGIALQVKANPIFDRQNADICQGDSNRRISELRGNSLPSVQIQSIWILAPTNHRINWIVQFRDVFGLAFIYIQKLPLAHFPLTSTQLQEVVEISWTYTAMRLAYRATDGSMSHQFGGPYSHIPKVAMYISIPIVLLLWALQLSSLKNRSSSLEIVHMNQLPYPLRQFFTLKFPSLRVWCDWNNIDDQQQTNWTLGPVIDVEPWTLRTIRK